MRGAGCALPNMIHWPRVKPGASASSARSSRSARSLGRASLAISHGVPCRSCSSVSGRGRPRCLHDLHVNVITLAKTSGYCPPHGLLSSCRAQEVSAAGACQGPFTAVTAVMAFTGRAHLLGTKANGWGCGGPCCHQAAPAGLHAALDAACCGEPAPVQR